LAKDEYRGNVGQAAALLLMRGIGANCLSTDHSGASELCVETIVRKQLDNTKTQVDATGMSNALRAANNLRAGIGVHKAQGDHSGGNTCATVLSLAT
jgi:hypothetical protein